MKKATTFAWTAGLAVLLGLLALWPRPAAAQAPQPAGSGITLSARAGFDGYCKTDTWLPVLATLENQGPDVEAQLAVTAAGMPGALDRYAQAVSLPSGARKQVQIFVRPSGYLSELQVTLSAGNKVLQRSVIQQIDCLSATDRLVGVVSPNPSAFNPLAAGQSNRQRVALAVLALGELPAQAAGLDALDALIFAGSDTGPLSEAQRAALEAWLGRGGLLVVAGGPDWQKTAAGLSDLLPLLPQETRTLENANALATFASPTQTVTATLAGPLVVAAGQLRPGAQALVEQAGLPLIASRAAGAGRVIYLAFDPSAGPLRGWSGLGDLYARLLDSQTTPPEWAGGFHNWNEASQAVSNLPKLLLPSGGLIAGFLILYVAAIGPLNYFLLMRLKRRELAWLTIPALVIAFSALAFLVGSSARGNRAVLNRLAVVQVWPGQAQARVDGLVGVFSPRRATVQLELDPRLLAHPLTEPGVAGGQGLTFLQNGPNGTTVPNLRVEVGGLQAVAVEGAVPAPRLQSEATLLVQDSAPILDANVENQTGLALADAVLIAPGYTRQVGSLAPGQRFSQQIVFADSAPAASAGFSKFTQPGLIMPSYGYGPYSQLVTDLLGVQSYTQERAIRRRISLVQALLDYNPGASTRGSGLYLAGWSAAAPFSAGLGGTQVENTDETLYLFSLPYNVRAQGDSLHLPPALFTWTVLEPGPRGEAAPYNVNLDNNSFSLAFQLSQPVSYQAVNRLTLHLVAKSPGSTPHVALWDFSANTWQDVPVAAWGDFDVTDPERFVGPGVEVRLRLDTAGLAYGTLLERADFTLELGASVRGAAPSQRGQP